MTPLFSTLLASSWLALASAYVLIQRMRQGAPEPKLVVVPVVERPTRRG